MIIETSDNRFYSVQPTQDPALDHVWIGFQVKRAKGEWIACKNSRVGLVRKDASRVVEA
jgi:hypothetical protein